MAWQPFWVTKTLSEMTADEWESLCDGCGKCCVHKLEDEETDEVFYTNIACRLLSESDCQCKDYRNRLEKVPDCISLSKESVDQFTWLPSSCSYRLVSENKPLPEWHHLITGSKESIHLAGASVKGKTLPEDSIAEEDFEHCIVRWIT